MIRVWCGDAGQTADCCACPSSLPASKANFPDHQDFNSLFNQQINAAAAGRVPIPFYTAIALLRSPVQMVRGKAVLAAEMTLLFRSLLVTVLIEAFERFTA